MWERQWNIISIQFGLIQDVIKIDSPKYSSLDVRFYYFQIFVHCPCVEMQIGLPWNQILCIPDFLFQQSKVVDTVPK